MTTYIMIVDNKKHMLKNHKQTMHAGKLFECHKCNYQVTSDSGLAVGRTDERTTTSFLRV